MTLRRTARKRFPAVQCMRKYEAMTVKSVVNHISEKRYYHKIRNIIPMENAYSNAKRRQTIVLHFHGDLELVVLK